MREMKERESDLLQKRMIALHGRIDFHEARRVNNALISLAQEDERGRITLSLHSGGGDVEPGFLLYEVISRLPCEVRALVPSQADSIAAVVLQACARRIMRESAFITLHEMEITMQGTVRVFRKDFPKYLAQAEREQEKMYQIVANRTGRPIQEVEAQFAKGIPLSAHEALKFGLVDEVLP